MGQVHPSEDRRVGPAEDHRVATGGDPWRPLYARVLGLRYVNPGGALCFLFFEGMIALAVLLALAERASWWAVLVLPAAVAAMVKVNDVVAGTLAASGSTARAIGRAAVPRTATGLSATGLRQRAGGQRASGQAADRTGATRARDR